MPLLTLATYVRLQTARSRGENGHVERGMKKRVHMYVFSVSLWGNGDDVQAMHTHEDRFIRIVCIFVSPRENENNPLWHSYFNIKS